MGRWLRVVRLRLRSLVLRRVVDRELDEELQYHVDQLTAQHAARGVPPGEARRLALASMDGLLQRREQCRDARGLAPVEDVAHDLRYAFRQCRRNPGFTIVVVAVLAIAIGGNTAIYSVARAALAPLPVPAADRVVMVWSENAARDWHQFPASMPDVRDWRASGVFGSLAAFNDEGFNLRLPDRTERVEGERTTADFFAVFGIAPARGRAFTAADGENVAVITDRLWRGTFASDPGIVGRSVTLDGAPHTILGVLPPDFPRLGQEDIYAPMSAATLATPRGSRSLVVAGRLRDGVSLAAARQRMVEVSAALARQYPDEDGGITVALQPIQAAYVQDAALLLNLLIAACLCGLTVAAANVASLVLARGVGRRRELAIRTALGGGRWRLTRQLITEQLALSTMAGAAAIGPAWLALRFIISFHLEELPNLESARLSLSVLAFNFAVASITGLVSGLAPAWIAWRNDVNSALKGTPAIDAGRPQQRLRKLFVVGQVALTAVLLIAGGLVLRSFLDVLAASPGYDAGHTLTMRVALSTTGYASGERQVAFFDRVVERAAALPGVVAASAAGELPLTDSLHGGGLFMATHPEVRAEDVPIVIHTAVMPGYFDAMVIPLVRGRWFTAHDGPDAPKVALIDRWTANRYWPSQDPIGQRIRLGAKQPWLEIVGVVGDVEAPVIVRFLKGRLGQVYQPVAQDPTPAMSLVLRARGDEKALVAPMRALVRGIDPDQPVFAVRSLAEQRVQGRSVVRLVTALLDGFAVMALLLAAVGLYGTIAYDVRQRTREFGLRMSLGAEPGDVLATVLRDGTKLLVAGLAVGALGAFAAIQLVASALSGIKSRDPITLLGAVGILALTGVLASYVPARRATRISPAVALRAD